MALAVEDRAEAIGACVDERVLVMAGYEQVLDGRTKDLHAVCDRLERRWDGRCSIGSR